MGKIEARLRGAACYPPASGVATAVGTYRAPVPPEVMVVVVRRYLRYALFSRDVEDLLLESGAEVDHVTVFRWVQRFTPL